MHKRIHKSTGEGPSSSGAERRGRLQLDQPLLQLQQVIGNKGVIRYMKRGTRKQAVTANLAKPSNFNIEIIQRDLEAEAEKWEKVRSKTRVSDGNISQIFNSYLEAKIHDKEKEQSLWLKQLKRRAEERLEDTNDSKKIKVLNRVLREIDKETILLGEELGKEAVKAYVLEHEMYKVDMENEPENEELKKVRAHAVWELAAEQTRKITTSNIDEIVRGLAKKGPKEGYWVGTGVCGHSAKTYSPTPREITKRTSDIGWNHFFIYIDGDRKTRDFKWKDPTYRQFLPQSDWSKGPPIFEGNVRDFLAYNFDAGRAESYLRHINAIADDQTIADYEGNN